MPKVKANNITMNYEQQGTGEPLVLILTWPPITPVMHSKWRSTQSTLPASQSTSADGRKRQTRR